MIHHDWFRDPHQGLAVAGVVVIWGAIPFLAITLHAGMSMVPKELNEAAEIDGANAWRRFRAVTLPILRPLLVIITTLSVIWDIQVFNQIYLLRHQSPEETYWTLAVYARSSGSETTSDHRDDFLAPRRSGRGAGGAAGPPQAPQPARQVRGEHDRRHHRRGVRVSDLLDDQHRVQVGERIPDADAALPAAGADAGQLHHRGPRRTVR
jgi:hypothetical protein